MIVVINSQGGLVSVQEEDLFQGSTNFNTVHLIAPFGSNVTFKAMFELPDGTYKPDDLDGYLLEPSIGLSKNLNVWKLPITFPITQNYGVVTMQLRGTIGETVVCTTSVKVPIQKGVPYSSNFEELSDKDQLLQLIADIRSSLSGKVDIVNSQYNRASNVTEDTVGKFFEYDSENDIYIPRTLPQDYIENHEYYEAVTTGRIVNSGDNLYIEYIDKESKQSVKLDFKDGIVTINEKQIVVFDDLIADNITYDNKLSGIDAENVKDALDKLKNDIDNIEISQTADLGEFVISAGSWEQSGDLYEYKFRNEQLVSVDTQSVIITPNTVAIDNLNEADILMYPEVDMQQEAEGIAVAIIKTDKKPDFDIVINVKIQTTSTEYKVEEIKAKNVTFIPSTKINVDNVQQAIQKVQANLETFIDFDYNDEKQYFAKLDDNGKVLAEQLPSVSKDYVEGYYDETSRWFYDDVNHIDRIAGVSNKLYVDKKTKKLYRFYPEIDNEHFEEIGLQLGETETTAYSGDKGAKNRADIDVNAQNIEKFITGDVSVKYSKATHNLIDRDTQETIYLGTTNQVARFSGWQVHKSKVIYNTPVTYYDFIQSGVIVDNVPDGCLLKFVWGDSPDLHGSDVITEAVLRKTSTFSVPVKTVGTDGSLIGFLSIVDALETNHNGSTYLDLKLKATGNYVGAYGDETQIYLKKIIAVMVDYI